jgi:hypothetical protein
MNRHAHRCGAPDALLRRLWVALLSALIEEMDDVVAGRAKLRPAMAMVTRKFLRDVGIKASSVAGMQSGLRQLATRAVEDLKNAEEYAQAEAELQDKLATPFSLKPIRRGSLGDKYDDDDKDNEK